MFVSKGPSRGWAGKNEGYLRGQNEAEKADLTFSIFIHKLYSTHSFAMARKQTWFYIYCAKVNDCNVCVLA